MNVHWISLLSLMHASSQYITATEIHPCQSTAFCTEHCNKRHVFHHKLWYSLETSHFGALKENLSLWICNLPYSPKSMRNPKAQFSYFSYLFQIATDVLKSSTNSGAPLYRLHSTNSLKIFWSMGWWAFGSGFISQWCITRMKFLKTNFRPDVQ